MNTGVSYPPDMRRRAKREMKTLACIDVEVDGCRATSKGLVTEQQARFLLWASVMATNIPEEKLPDMKRMYERRKAQVEAEKEES